MKLTESGLCMHVGESDINSQVPGSADILLKLVWHFTRKDSTYSPRCGPACAHAPAPSPLHCCDHSHMEPRNSGSPCFSSLFKASGGLPFRLGEVRCLFIQEGRLTDFPFHFKIVFSYLLSASFNFNILHFRD